jgi:GntR family transcriptional regulator
MKPIKNRPLQLLAKESILEFIKTNDFDSNKLPTEEMFCKMLGVSRVTVRGVLNELALEGFIFRKHGKGTFVNREALNSKAPLTPLKPFKEIITDLGYECSIKNLGYEEINEKTKEIRNILRLENKEDKIITTEKIFFANKIPVVYCKDYFSTSLLSNMEDCNKIKEYENSIFEFFKIVCSKEITWDRVEIGTTSNLKEPFLNDIFNCEGIFKDFLVVKGINYDESNFPIVYALEYVDTSYIPFSLIRKKII